VGSVKRAEDIASKFKDRTIRTLARLLLSRCGNCGLKYDCLNAIVPVEDLLTTAIGREQRAALAPGTVAKAMARFLKGNCLDGCYDNRMPRCATYVCWCVGRIDDAPELVARMKEWRDMNEEVLACRIQWMMRECNISEARLVKDVARTLVECKIGGKFRTGVTGKR